MLRRVVRPTAFALVLGLVAIQAGAAPLSRDREKESEGQLKRLPHVLVMVWERLTSIVLKNGSGIDPFGKPEPGEDGNAAPQGGGENGSVIDPFG
jgi:hypothetical protein